MVTTIISLEACFDPAAIAKVRQMAQANPPYILSSGKAKALIGLKKAKVADLHGSVHAALDIILVHRLVPKQIGALVAWMASGKPASEFDPKAKPSQVASVQQVESEDETEEKPLKPKKGTSHTLGQQVGGGIDQIVHLLSKSQTGDSAKTSGQSQAKRTRKGKSAVAFGLKKLGEKAGKIAWKDVFKLEHHLCRKLAHAIVPSRAHSAGSGRTHSGRSRNSGSIRQGLITLFLTVLHWVVYVLLQYSFLLAAATFLICPFVPALKPWVEWPFRFAAHVMIDSFPAWVWANAQSHLGPALFIGVVLLAGFYYAWKAEPLRISLLGIALAYLIAQGRGFADLPSPWSQSTASETPTVNAVPEVSQSVRSSDANGDNNEPLAQPSLVPPLVTSAQVVRSSNLKPKTSNSSLQTTNSNVVSYQPSVAFNTATSTDASTAATLSPINSSGTLYDAKLLEQEIAAVPKNSIIKAFPLTPDETMPGDLAVSRLQDLTDPDKYTMKLGSDTEKIISVNATTTNFIVNFKSADAIGGFLSGSGPLNLFWEDVIAIHTDTVRSSELGSSQLKTSNSSLLTTNSGGVTYQCSLIVTGAKHPFTVQCSTSADLEHLVSTMEYFIRASRLAHDTALAGMPYPNQGIRLNDKNLVEVLWANSPAAKAGLTLGDMLWSLERNTPEQQDRRKLEAQLSALTSGPHDLYIVSPADRNAGLVQMNANNTNVFNPKRQKTIITVF